MRPTGPRIQVMHGVNLDQLGRRDPEHYGSFTLIQLESRILEWARELDVAVAFFQSNHEGVFVEHLHAVWADGLILNPGAWTHYSYAIRDALELTGIPAVEVHLSDVRAREPFRSISVIGDVCLATVAGRGPDGYREALRILQRELT